jgi:ribonucleoside-triphosphate reductase
MILVTKRDGTLVPFDKEKIISAINAAFIEIDGKLYEDDTAKDIADDIEDYFKYQDGNGCNVEEIQDLVEKYLMRSERPDVARAYIRYRYKKEVARDVKSDFFDAIREKLEARNVQN